MNDAPPPRRRFPPLLPVPAIGTALAGVCARALATDAFGAAHLFDRAVAKVDRFLAGPVPDRSAPDTVLVTAPPEDSEALDPDEVPLATPVGDAGPALTPIPAQTATSTPIPTVPRVPVTFDIVA